MSFLPILPVLEPESITISDTLKLVQDDGGENWTWTINRLQETAGEQLQFRNIVPIKVCQISEQL